MKTCLETIQYSIRINRDFVCNLSPREDLDKVIHCHRTFLFYVYRVNNHLSRDIYTN